MKKCALCVWGRDGKTSDWMILKNISPIDHKAIVGIRGILVYTTLQEQGIRKVGEKTEAWCAFWDIKEYSDLNALIADNMVDIL